MQEDGLGRGMSRLARLAGAATLLVSAAVLLAWALDIEALQRIRPAWPAMAPATALAFALAALSLALAARAFAPVAQITAAAAAFIGLLRLIDLASPWGWPGAVLGFSAGTGRSATMAPATALNFVLIGCALICASRGRLLRVFQAAAVVVMMIGWLGLSRYLYGGAPLVPYTTMALHTALLFVVLSIGTLCLHPDVGVVALLTRRSAGGSIARRLFPAAVLVPLAMGWIPLYAQRAGLLGTEAGFSLFSLTGVFLFAALVWVNAAQVDRLDEQRLQAQLGKHASEVRTRLILENALDAVISIDRTGTIESWSGQAQATFGWSQQEAIGRSLAETIIPPADRAAHERGLGRYLGTRESRILGRRVELSALHRNGTAFPVEIAITPIHTDGEVSFSAFVRDITEQRRAEGKLRESEEHFRTLAESLPQLVWTCRADGWCDYLSRQWLEYTGRTHEQEVGYGWAEQLHPEDRVRVQAEWLQATVRGQLFDIEFRIRRADGVYRWFKTRAVPLRDASGGIVKWFGSNTDMDDVKRSEGRLRTQLERLMLLDRTTHAIGERQDLRSIFQVVLRSLEDHLPIDFGCIFLYDAAQQSLTVNCVGSKSASLAQLLCLEENATIGIDANGLSRCLQGQLVYEPDISQLLFSFPRRLAAAGLRAVVIAPLIAESRVFGVMVAARAEPVSFASGDCEFLRQLCEHVGLAAHQAQLYSDLERSYEDLRQTQQTMLQQERLRAFGQMASGIAHDINNALSPAALYVQSLLERDTSLSAQAREYLTSTRRAIEDVANTVARMREFYRRREPEVALEPVESNRLIEQVIELTRARWSDMPQERGVVIELETNLAHDVPAILGAQSEIRDALTNLVLNAVDAMPSGGTLRLASYGTPANACIEVSDTGAGMDEATRNRCVEPFFTTKGERGTGLGLAMVYGMAQRHGGELQIESEPGSGTTVRLLFPRADTRIETPAPQRMRRPQRALRLLVIDDDPLLLQSLSTILAEDGHVVVALDRAESGLAAFSAAQGAGEAFDAVITDLGMPYMDGRKVAAAIKTESPATPVILLTGWGHRMLAENTTPEHVDRVLAKPPKLADLRGVLAELTAAPQLISADGD